MKCEDDAAMKTHLEELMKLQAQLQGMGAGLPDDELVTVILGSLPKSYQPLVSMISMSTKMMKSPLEPMSVIDALCEKYDHLAIDENKT
jgi:hypothetical protein